MKKLVLLVALFITLIAPNALAGEFLKGKILRIDLSKSVSERKSSDLTLSANGLQFNSSVSLLDIDRALQKAAKDDHIAMVFLNLDHFSADMASMEEIRSCLKDFSAAGKPVVAYAASLSNGSYYLGSVADRIFMYPKGEGSLNGIGSTQFYLKDILDTLDIDVQLIRHGKYKSAGEMYILNDISPENREQIEVLLGSVWTTFTDEMAASRGMEPEKVRSLSDNLALGTAQSWLDAGLIDGLKYRDEMELYLAKLFGTNDPTQVKAVDLEEYMEKLKKGPANKKVAVIYAEGEIAREGSCIVGDKLSRQIAAVRADSTVKAVVFRVNSPGGEVVAADMIRREIELLRKDKPVVASYGAYAASGGYLISAGCDRIITDNTTFTGSIGVFGMVPSFGKAIRKNLHVTPVQVGTGPHSGMSSGMNPLTPEEEAWYQEEIEGIYTDFVGIVAEGRSMTTETVDEIAQGRVWTGKDALGIGLADETGTLLDAIDCAAKLAGKELGKNYRIAVYPEKKSFKDKLKDPTGKGDDKDKPLVRVDDLLHPGLNIIARMPYVGIEYQIKNIK